MERSRAGRGCCFCSVLATLDEPMKASTSTLPDSMIGPTISLPRPKTTLTTPGGKASRNASSSGSYSSTPSFGVLKTTGLPMISAGISVVKVSFSG